LLPGSPQVVLDLTLPAGGRETFAFLPATDLILYRIEEYMDTRPNLPPRRPDADRVRLAARPARPGPAVGRDSVFVWRRESGDALVETSSQVTTRITYRKEWAGFCCTAAAFARHKAEDLQLKNAQIFLAQYRQSIYT
jgi:hypothetical protein